MFFIVRKKVFLKKISFGKNCFLEKETSFISSWFLLHLFFEQKLFSIVQLSFYFFCVCCVFSFLFFFSVRFFAFRETWRFFPTFSFELFSEDATYLIQKKSVQKLSFEFSSKKKSPFVEFHCVFQPCTSRLHLVDCSLRRTMSTQHWSRVVTSQAKHVWRAMSGTYRWWKPRHRDLLSYVTFLLVMWPVLCCFSFSTRELVYLRKRRDIFEQCCDRCLVSLSRFSVISVLRSARCMSLLSAGARTLIHYMHIPQALSLDQKQCHTLLTTLKRKEKNTYFKIHNALRIACAIEGPLDPCCVSRRSWASQVHVHSVVIDLGRETSVASGRLSPSVLYFFEKKKDPKT